MRVRIQWEIPRAEALTLSALLAPASLAAFTTGCWQIAAQLRWTNTSLVSGGVFSHGQVWLAAAAVLLLPVSLLDYCTRDETSEEHEITPT